MHRPVAGEDRAPGIRPDQGARGRCRRGFTLMEVLVGLILGSLILGGVMGVLSATLDFRHRLGQREKEWPALEEAAQRLLVSHEELREGTLVLDDLEDSPEVEVSLTKVDDLPDEALGGDRRVLYRVKLAYGKSRLEFSRLIPLEGFDDEVEEQEGEGEDATESTESDDETDTTESSATP